MYICVTFIKPRRAQARAFIDSNFTQGQIWEGENSNVVEQTEVRWSGGKVSQSWGLFS